MTRYAGLLTLGLVVGVGSALAAPGPGFEARVAAQRAIEEVYWRHRSWPKENPGPKPPLADVLPEWVLRERDRLSEACLGAVRRLLPLLQAAGETARAIQYGRRAVALDPLCEEAYSDLMRLLAAAGRAALACGVRARNFA